MANQLALLKRDTVDVVADKVRAYQESGELNFPANYSPSNSLKSAWLTLQSAKDKNGKPVLETCTRDSIANSLLDMVVQGLTPAKEQGYFIAYGTQLTWQPSYFGVMAVCKRVTNATDITAQPIYEGDEFEFSINNGRVQIDKHTQKLENIGKKILGAYCVVEFGGDRPNVVGLMTREELASAWAMSPMKSNKTRDDFPQQMAKKTVIRRTCKPLINSSDDGSLVLKHFQHAEEASHEARIEAEVADNASREPLDIEDADYSEPAPAKEPPQPEKQKDDWADDAPPF